MIIDFSIKRQKGTTIFWKHTYVKTLYVFLCVYVFCLCVCVCECECVRQGYAVLGSYVRTHVCRMCVCVCVCVCVCERVCLFLLSFCKLLFGSDTIYLAFFSSKLLKSRELKRGMNRIAVLPDVQPDTGYLTLSKMSVIFSLDLRKKICNICPNRVVEELWIKSVSLEYSY